LVYSESIEKIEFLPYKPRKIHALVMVSADHIEYPLKFEDRTELEALGKAISLPNEDILIVKENKITDTSFANIVFFDGRHWFTPSSPLLKGTKRARYLYEGRISERIISPDDLRFYRKARLINAMIDLEDSEDILIEQIRPADGCDKRTINPNSGDRM
jgi:4-amino-4-deoxychorismate lyase